MKNQTSQLKTEGAHLTCRSTAATADNQSPRQATISPYERYQTLAQIKQNWRARLSRWLCPTCGNRMHVCKRNNPPASCFYCETCGSKR